MTHIYPCQIADLPHWSPHILTNNALDAPNHNLAIIVAQSNLLGNYKE